MRWCDAHIPEMRRGKIFPRSGTYDDSNLTSLKSMISTLSMQKRQIFRRCMRRGPRPMPARSYSRSKPYPPSRSSKFCDITLSFQWLILFHTRAIPHGMAVLGGFRFRIAIIRIRRFRFSRRGPAFGFLRATTFQLVRAATIFVDADCHIAKDAIVNPHAALQLSDFCARALDFKQNINAVSLVIDFVRELAPSHHFGLGDSAALVRDDFLKRLSQAHHLGIVGVRVNNENYLVSSFICQNNLLSVNVYHHSPLASCKATSPWRRRLVKLRVPHRRPASKSLLLRRAAVGETDRAQTS